MLTEETIRQHLEGKITVGLYAINPSTQRCKWVAIDADYKNSMEDLLKLQYHLTQDRVEPALEMSKRGGHLWIFLATPLLAKECRIYIHDLALRLGVPVKGSGLADGIEVFPEARRHRSRRVWQRHSRSAGNPPWRQSPILVLRRRLHAGGPDRIPQPSAKSHRGRTAEVHRWEGKARAGFLAASGEGHFNANEKLGTDDRNFAFWSTWVRCGRSAGTTSRAVHPARTVATTGAATTWPS